MDLNTQDIEILNECKELIFAFKHHLSIINGEFLAHHIIGVIRKGWVKYRDPDNDWYHKDFCADLDCEAKSSIGIDKQTGHFFVAGTSFRDYYLYDLINSFRVETEDNYQKDTDEKRIKELESQWKKYILSNYQRDEHLRRFVWDLAPFTHSDKYGHLRGQVIEMTKQVIPNNVDFYSFIYCGLSYKCLDYNHPYGIHVAIKNAVGLFGNYVHYGRDKVVMKDQTIIDIPPTTFAPGLRHCTIVEISKGAFESLHEVEKIILPSTIRKIDWSFWHCRKLKIIDVDKDNKTFGSIDGVLYSKDHKVLFAYPNMHGSIYEVPEGVETIERFAFKDCDNIELIMLPSTLKLIKLNAFYRATNLKKVVCACRIEDFVNEGFYGEYGDVNPQWFYIK